MASPTTATPLGDAADGSTYLKLRLHCSECRAGDVDPAFEVSIREDRVYDTVCSRGHRVETIVRALRHEILFEIAVDALKDGYYREAVLSFDASRERFQEVAIRIILQTLGADRVSIEAAWKVMNSQSERQLGAYTALWPAKYRETARILTPKEVAHRNRVAHQGLIPSEEQAEKFGEAVYNIIVPSIDRLNENRDSVTDELNRQMFEAYDRARPDGRWSQLSPGLMLNSREIRQGPLQTFAYELERRRRIRAP